MHYREVNAYLQDTWKALPRVSITVGVRWDKSFLPQPPVTNPTYFSTGTIPSSNIAFSPRVSLGYLVNDTTVIRAGFGFFYQPYSGQFTDALLEGNGLSQTSITVNPDPDRRAVVSARAVLYQRPRRIHESDLRRQQTAHAAYAADHAGAGEAVGARHHR